MKNIIKKSVIFYLINDNQIHLNRLFSSLYLLNKNFLSSYPYPVVFGHEGLPQDAIDHIKKILNVETHFFNINFILPDYTEEIKNKIPFKFKGHWDENAFFSIGYRHMCRLFSGDIFNYDFFSNVDYFLRLDCDSYFIDEIKYDIFDFVKTNNILYATVGERQNEMDYVIEGFEDFCKNYFKDAYRSDCINNTFDTHFELINFKWFKEGPYMKYFKAIDDTANIFIKRWGDAPIKYQGVKNLIPSQQIHIFDLPYKHGGDYAI
jgi:hypothetical protein